MAGRTKFSLEQLRSYFHRVHLPEAQQIFDIHPLSSAQQLDYLTLLCKHHIVSVPWENLSQHYTYARSIQTHATALHAKIVGSSNNTSNNRGGYCMETNHLLHMVLHSLGFRAWLSGARIYSSRARAFGGWTHVVNLVAVAGQRYMLDGGFGGGAPPQPVPVRDGVAVPMALGTAGAEVRVVRRALNAHVDPDQRVWLYQFRYKQLDAAGAPPPPAADREGIEGDERAGWRTGYCFTDLEFLPADLADMNFAPLLNPRTFFTHKVVITRFSTAAERMEKPGAPDEAALAAPIDGSITLIDDTLKWRRNGQTVVDLTLNDEAERVAALENYFGVVLRQEDRNAIVGSAAMLAMTPIGE